MARDEHDLLSELDQGVLFKELNETGRRLYTTGILPSQHIRDLVSARRVWSDEPISPDQIQPASLDLRLGPVAYCVRASFLPSRTTPVLKNVHELCVREIDLTTPSVLEVGSVYIVPLLEELVLPRDVWARANPKSTTGRLDVFTRLITDYNPEFERVQVGYRGKLYVEIVPRSFSIRLRKGTRVNQLRFIKGAPLPSDANLSELHAKETLVFKDAKPTDPEIAQGLWIAVDLEGGSDSEVVGYRAKRHAPVIDFHLVKHYDPHEYWEPLRRSKAGNLVLDPRDFYILASKGKIRVPNSYAASMIPYDPSVGEFRIHYAGFFDPGFGYGNNDIKGATAVLEVRSHEVPFLLEDNQRVGRLVYERLLAIPDKIYGTGIGSSYQNQGIALSKQFKEPGTASSIETRQLSPAHGA